MNANHVPTTAEVRRQVAAAVATHLPEGWTYDTTSPEYLDRITGPDGAVLVLVLDWRNADRLEIRGAYDGDRDRMPYGISPRTITVARDKAPERIAGDIVRRLLPDYVIDLGRVNEYRADLDSRADMLTPYAERVESRRPVDRIGRDDRPTSRHHYIANRGSGIYGDIKARVSDGEIVADLDIHGLTETQLLAALDAIASA